MTLVRDQDFDFLCDKYRQGGDVGGLSNFIFYASGYFLINSNIYKNIDSASLILNQLEKLRLKKNKDHEVMATLSFIFLDFYKHIIDDTAIASSFENYSKGMLLKRRYIVNVVEMPEFLKREQSRKPIHFLRYRNLLKKGHNVKLSKNTLPLSILIKVNYLERIGYSVKYQPILKKIIDHRNMIHFMGITGIKPEKVFLNHIYYLKANIEK